VASELKSLVGWLEKVHPVSNHFNVELHLKTSSLKKTTENEKDGGVSRGSLFIRSWSAGSTGRKTRQDSDGIGGGAEPGMAALNRSLL
jgi:hypothetical protein